MRSVLSFAAASVVFAAVLAPSPASAHAKIVASTPAEGATIARPRTLSLTFSEALSAQTAATSIVMIAMPGMADHPPMTIRNYQSSWSADNRTVTLTLRQPLATGSYELRWQATGADGHMASGKVGFAVR
ncbi:copper resistance protein CopC [Sphingomonas sp. MMS24-J45]|uniref:copper resistance protein CopC n=1 Tax=Sphingomonas sp. MMS24-J45 TaxID=3238806 RepID=UPI00384CE6C9